MLTSLASRLEWLTCSFLPGTLLARREAKQLLDVGRYDGDPNREAILSGLGFEYNRLVTAPDNSGEAVADEPYKWDRLPDESFDLVVSTHCLEHVAFPWLVMQEIHRVLKPGGLVIAIEPGIPERADAVATGRIDAFNKHQFLTDFYRFSGESLKALAEYAGLSVVHASANEWPAGLAMKWFSISHAILVAQKPGEGIEAEQWHGGFSKKSDDTVWARSQKTKPVKITCIGACFHLNSYYYLRLAALNAEVNLLGAKVRPDKDENGGGGPRIEVDKQYYENSDVLILPDQPSFDTLTCKGGKVLRIPYFEFYGFHPDMTAPPVREPRGMPSSNIALECYRRGHSEAHALSMFTHATYLRLGYYSAWDNNCALVKNQFKRVGLQLEQFLPRWMARGVFMHDPLHPVDFVIKDLLDYLCMENGIELDPGIYDGYGYFDYTHKYRLPVYPEIAEHLNIPEVGSYRFKRTFPATPPWTYEDTIGLEEYIHYAYNEYAENPEAFEKHPRLEAL